MTTEALLRQAVKGALALGSAGTMVGAGAALAQTAAPAASTATTKLSNIVVVGSHIPQTSIATAQPVITINRQEIENTGFTTTGQLLQNLPSAVGPALNEQFNNGGNGEENINLHDLGAQRVLVLVNGQRWIPDLAGQIDLTTIPLSIIDHVEVLLDGASAIYGSEAIAGVINIVTQKNFNGATASAYYGMYDGHGDGGGWDGKTQQYSFTVGTSGDKSAVLLSAGYYQQQPVWAGNRNISKEPYVGFGTQNGSSGTPGGRFAFFTPFYYGHTTPSFPGCSASGFFGLPGCDISGGHAPGNPAAGATGFAAGQEHPWSNADRYNYAPVNYLLTPQERWDIYSQGHYDITDNLTFNFMTSYVRRDSHQVLAPNPWFFCPGLAGSGCLLANGLPVGVSGSNPYNPFHQDLVPAYSSSSPGPGVLGAWCSAYGSGTTPGTCSSNWQVESLIGIRPLAIGLRDFQEHIQNFYFNGGFQGFFMLANNQWNWNANYIYGSRLDTAITNGLVNTARMQQALAQGNADGTCSSAHVPCLDIFGGPPGMAASPGAKYISATLHDVVQSNVRDYNANVGGTFWNSWYAGPWGAAVGYEYYENDGFFSPDDVISSGNTVGNVASPTSGREASNAEYAELSIPFANDAPFAKKLTLDLANRWEQYKWNGIGNVFNPNTGQVNVQPAGANAHSAAGRATFQWQPIDSLLFRGTWSQGFRVPSLSELFSGAGDNFPSLVDPCDTTVPAAMAPYCAAHGRIPTAYSYAAGQIHTTIGGNAQLQPETATSRSIGFVFSPSFVPGLDISADYYKIEVLHFVGRFGGNYYLSQCYYHNNGDACSKIILAGSNGPTQHIVNIVDLTSNGGSDKVSGWDVSGRYKLPTTPVGDFTVNAGMNFTKQDVFCDASGNCVDSAGTASAAAFFGVPKHRYNLSLDWSYGPWAAVWTMRIIGPMWEDCTHAAVNGEGPTAGAPPTFGWCSKIFDYRYADGTFGPTPSGGGAGNPAVSVYAGQNHLGTTVYNDLQGSYTVASWNTTFTLGVNNVFDKQPPISRTAFANSYLPNYYDVPGRFWYGRISVNF